MTSRLRRTRKAVLHQRFSFVPVVVLFILSVPSGAAILEQLPDALRRWISDGGVGRPAGDPGDALHPGSRRVPDRRRLVPLGPRLPPSPDPPPTGARPGATAGRALALPVGLAGRPGRRRWPERCVALVTAARRGHPGAGGSPRSSCCPSLVIVGSLLLRRRWQRHPRSTVPTRRPTFDERELSAVRLAGHIAGLGADRGRRAQPAPRVRPAADRSRTPRRLGLVWLFLVIGGDRGHRALAGGPGRVIRMTRTPPDRQAGAGPPTAAAEQPGRARSRSAAGCCWSARSGCS